MPTTTTTTTTAHCRECVEVLSTLTLESTVENEILDGLLESIHRQEAAQSLISNELESQVQLLDNIEQVTESQEARIRSTTSNLMNVQSEMNTSYDLFWVIIGLFMILFGLLIFIKFT